MALTAGLFVCALLAMELASVLFLAGRFRARRKRHQTGSHTPVLNNIAHRRLS